jgi:hypothetical protein
MQSTGNFFYLLIISAAEKWKQRLVRCRLLKMLHRRQPDLCATAILIDPVAWTQCSGMQSNCIFCNCNVMCDYDQIWIMEMEEDIKKKQSFHHFKVQNMLRDSVRVHQLKSWSCQDIGFRPKLGSKGNKLAPEAGLTRFDIRN